MAVEKNWLRGVRLRSRSTVNRWYTPHQHTDNLDADDPRAPGQHTHRQHTDDQHTAQAPQ